MTERLLRRPARRLPAHRAPAMVVVIVYLGLLFLIPSRLVVAQIGAAGTPANLWALGALVWWAAMTVGGLRPVGANVPIRFALAVLAACVGVSYVVAMTSGWYVAADVREATSDIFDLVPASAELVRATSVDAADRGLIAFGSWLGIALVTCDGLRSWDDLERVVRWLTTFAGAVGAIGLIQYFAGWNIASLFEIPGLVANQEFGAIDARSVVRRVYATAVHPIEFGVVLAASFPLAVHRAIYDRRHRWRWWPAAVIGLAVPVSISRSGILVLLAGLLALFVGWPWQWRARMLMILPAAIVGIRLLMPGVVGTIIAFFTHFGEDPSVAGRTNDYEVVFREFAHQPWFGRGLYTFIPRFYRILDNQYLVLLLEIGVIGLAAAVAMMVIAFGCARGARRRASTPETQHVSLALSGSIAGLALCYATFDAWSAPLAAGLSFVVIGLIGAAYRLSREAESTADAASVSPDASTSPPGRGEYQVSAGTGGRS